MGNDGGWLGWWALGLVLVAWALWRAAEALIWRPRVLTRSFANQGVRGPPYRFFWGSLREIKALYAAAAAAEVLDPRSHDIAGKVVPHYDRWFRQYGGTLFYWLGAQPTVLITDPEMAKQVLSKFTFFTKGKAKPSLVALLGKGLVLAEGVDWVRHRRVVSPAFAMEKLKALTATLADCTATMLDGWRAQFACEDDPCKEIEMDSQFLELTATIFGLAAFGIAGDDGKKVFQAQHELQKLAFATIVDLPFPALGSNNLSLSLSLSVSLCPSLSLSPSVCLSVCLSLSLSLSVSLSLSPSVSVCLSLSLSVCLSLSLSLLVMGGFDELAVHGGHRYLPTLGNLELWKQDRRQKRLLCGIIRRRLASGAASYGDDLLGIMMDACRGAKAGGLSLSLDEIMDECKTFFFGGHETTAHLLTWTMLLLSTHPDWQEKLRQEALDVCGPAAPPDANKLSKLKLTTMVLLEVSRLYSPVAVMFRRAAEDMTLEKLKIPKGTSVAIPLLMMHRNTAVWGADALEFNPLRFHGGVSNAAAHPNALLTFSVGPRSCIGRDFAMLEAKLVLAMILRRFSFTLSPSYRHEPKRFITLLPQFGLPLLVRPLYH